MLVFSTLTWFRHHVDLPKSNIVLFATISKRLSKNRCCSRNWILDTKKLIVKYKITIKLCSSTIFCSLPGVWNGCQNKRISRTPFKCSVQANERNSASNDYSKALDLSRDDQSERHSTSRSEEGTGRDGARPTPMPIAYSHSIGTTISAAATDPATTAADSPEAHNNYHHNES